MPPEGADAAPDGAHVVSMDGTDKGPAGGAGVGNPGGAAAWAGNIYLFLP